MSVYRYKAFVILSVDLTNEASDKEADDFKPKYGEWELTEHNEQYEYDYLAEEFEDSVYKDGKHRKWVALLSRKDFEAWLNDELGYTLQEAREYSEQTMGSLTGFGMLPAYSLRQDGMDWNVGGVTNVIDWNAYITEAFQGSPLVERR
jgi:hypothetical protein